MLLLLFLCLELGSPDALDDLEDGRPADNKDEETQQPGSHGVVCALPLQTLGHIPPLCDVLGRLLVGNPHSLLGGHLDVVRIYSTGNSVSF